MVLSLLLLGHLQPLLGNVIDPGDPVGQITGQLHPPALPCPVTLPGLSISPSQPSLGEVSNVQSSLYLSPHNSPQSNSVNISAVFGSVCFQLDLSEELSDQSGSGQRGLEADIEQNL